MPAHGRYISICTHPTSNGTWIKAKILLLDIRSMHRFTELYSKSNLANTNRKNSEQVGAEKRRRNTSKS